MADHAPPNADSHTAAHRRQAAAPPPSFRSRRSTSRICRSRTRARRSRSGSTEAPQVEVGLRTRGEQIEPDVYECVLTMTVTARAGDKTRVPGRGVAGGHLHDPRRRARPAAAGARDPLPDGAVPVRARNHRRCDDARRAFRRCTSRRSISRRCTSNSLRKHRSAAACRHQLTRRVGALRGVIRRRAGADCACRAAAGARAAADFRATSDAADRALRRAVGAGAKPLFVYGRDMPRRGDRRRRRLDQGARRGGHDRLGRQRSRLSDQRDARRARAVADVRAQPDDSAPLVFRAEQNVLLELAETGRVGSRRRRRPAG